jgi:hypothetical protein
MNHNHLSFQFKSKFVLIVCILVLATMACQNSSAQQPNTQATIDAAVQATANAQFVAQATLDAAAQATSLAQQTQVEPTPTNTPVVPPTAAAAEQQTEEPTADTATSEYATLTEEELVALIEQTAAAAAESAAQYSTAATSATADETVTAEEVQTIEVYVSGAEEALETAEELIGVYYDLYGDVAAETLAAVEEINTSLAVIADSTASMSQSLAEINSSLEQGLALAEETITQVETAAQTAGAQAQQTQQQAQTLATTYQAQVEAIVNEAMATQPNQVASDPQAALQSALEFVTTAQQASADGAISPAELATIAQLGANASAGLNAQSIPQLQQLSGSVNSITEQLARGDVAQAQAGLNQLGGSLNGLDIASLTGQLGGGGISLPGGGSAGPGGNVAGGGQPSLPGKPSR